MKAWTGAGASASAANAEPANSVKAGLAWEFAPGVKLGAGYQFEYLSGIGYKNFYNDANGVPAGSAGQFTHGPFARISFNY